MEVPITFYPSKLKNILLFLACLMFVFLALLMNKTEELFYWLCLLFFGSGAVFFVLQILYPHSSFLKISEKGIEMRTVFRSSFLPWEVIKNFEIGTIYYRFGNKKMIVINFEDSYNKQNFGREIARSMTSIEGALPDNYGMKYEELVKILNGHKDKFTKD